MNLPVIWIVNRLKLFSHLFRKVNQEQGTAILFVTHNAALAERCDKIIQVIDGKLIS
jgi:ABC-type lipoprotein export system ATPase subunit